MVEYIKDDVMSSKNRNIELGKEVNKLCPTCGVQSHVKLRIRSNIDGTVGMECGNCGYSEFLPENKVVAISLDESVG